MGGQGAAVAGGVGPRSRWTSRPVVVGLGVAAVLAIATALLVVLLGGGAASAQTDPNAPLPYGGQLERVDSGDAITGEQVLEVAMLTLGTVNGIAFAIAMVASRLRGPTTAQTRRALIARTGAGVVSESRRERRDREQARTARPGVGHGPSVAGPHPGGPSARVPRTPPSGAVPAQGGPAPREGLVPAGRAPIGPPPPPAPSGPRPTPVPASPPAGVPAPIRPAVRR